MDAEIDQTLILYTINETREILKQSRTTAWHMEKQFADHSYYGRCFIFVSHALLILGCFRVQ